MAFCVDSGCTLELCACGRYLLCWSTSSCVQGSGYAGVLIAGPAPLAEVGVGIICMAFWEFTGLHMNTPFSFWETSVISQV